MRRSLQSIFFTGLLAAGCLLSQTMASAQMKYDWGNPDIPYVDQRGFSIGFNFGSADLWGDVGTKSFVDHYLNDNYTSDVFNNMRFMGGVFARYTYVPGISFRLGVNYGSLYATDKWNEQKAKKAKTIEDDAFQRYVRNLDAYNNIWEGNLLFEFSPFQVSNWEFGHSAKWNCQPYLLMGASVFHFNPQGTYVNLETGQEKKIDLQPLHTEGENFSAPGYTFPENYSLWSYAAVGGVGFRFDIGRGLGLGLEYQLRYTFTDYLDDVSGKYVDPMIQDIAFLNENGKNMVSRKMSDRSNEVIPGYHHTAGEFRGDPNNNDMFSTVSIMFYWKIDKRALPWWK